MTPRDKKLVRQTFAMVLPIAKEAAAIFYGRLFEVAPEYRPMFKNNIEEQGKKLMQMIGVGVAHLDRLGRGRPGAAGVGSPSRGLWRDNGQITIGLVKFCSGPWPRV